MKKIIALLLLIYIGINCSHAQKIEYESIQINYLSLLGFDSIGSNWGKPKSIPCYIEFTIDSHINVRVEDEEGRIYYKYDQIPFMSVDFDDNVISLSLGASQEEISNGTYMIFLRNDRVQIDFHDPAYEDNEEREKEIELKNNNSNKQRNAQEQMDRMLKKLLTYKGRTIVIVDRLEDKLRNLGYEL